MVMDHVEIVLQGKCYFVANYYNVNNLLVTSTQMTHAHMKIYPFQYVHNYTYRSAPLFEIMHPNKICFHTLALEVKRDWFCS